MKLKSIGSLLLSLSIIILSPSLIFAHEGHGDHPGVFHWMDHLGEVVVESAGAAIWIVPALLICASLIRRVCGRSH